jgi:transposase
MQTPLLAQQLQVAHLRGAERRPGFRISDHRFHHRAGPTSMRRAQKGTQKQALGRSRGGLTSKIHLAVRGLGLPVRFLLTAGQRNDITQAHTLVAGLPAGQVMADTAFDADHLRRDIAATGAQAVIPSHPARAKKLPFDTALYKERHLVECCLNKLKHFRRVATRYDKVARNFLAAVQLISAMVLLN